MIAEKQSYDTISIVGSWLKNHGYRNIEIINDNSQSVEIEADSNARRICVHVKTSSDEGTKLLPRKSIIDQVKSYGMSNFREPWIAVVRLIHGQDSNHDITWVDLSKH